MALFKRTYPVPISILPSATAVSGGSSFNCTVGVQALVTGDNFVVVDCSNRALLQPPTNADNPAGTWPCRVRISGGTTAAVAIGTQAVPNATPVTLYLFQDGADTSVPANRKGSATVTLNP